ncbi:MULTISPECIES: hypothetical protein [unclassified Acinetobacter]|uniref:hypothetical protein n=1 Tax=unclassified Acinetobacter TaxID=196816 RepID=UPI0015D2AE34|nr:MULTISPECIES: hypothetical protein [unclassified Acinetobacter]
MLPSELFEKRRQNLTQAIDHWVATGSFKNGKAVCEHFGLAVPLISQLLNSHRQIGEKFARELESQLGLIKGSLDYEVQFIEQDKRTKKQASLVLFEMQVVETQAFSLKLISNDSSQYSALFKNTQDLYLIRITASYYAPVLQEGWLVVCDERRGVERSDLACVYLRNGLNLILNVIQQTDDTWQFASLDQKRQVEFLQSDIEKLHPIIAILPSSFI